MAKHKQYSSNVDLLDFGTMIEVPRGSGQPRVTRDFSIETVILKLVDDESWVITKTGMTLTKKYGDQFDLVEPNEPPLHNLYLPSEGELAYWFYGFSLDINVPITGMRFRLLVPYRFDDTTTIPRGTVIEYWYTLMGPYQNDKHHNMIRYFKTVEEPIRELSFYALTCDKYLQFDSPA